MSNPSLILPQSPAYGEDYVYAAQVNDGVVPLYNVLPLTFTRASGGTRINKDGLVQDMPYNLLYESQSFSVTGGAWNYTSGSGVTTGQIGYDGTTNAVLFTDSGANPVYGAYQSFTQKGSLTLSIYAKAGSTNFLYIDIFQTPLPNVTVNLSTGTITSGSGIIENVGNGWYRISVTAVMTDTYYVRFGCPYAGTVYLQNIQVNIGSTAQPYLATTDRLNMPRITYPVGGGCGALLLEKQSTNLVKYSEDYTQSNWNLQYATITANNTTSPDGTQNADLLKEDSTNNFHRLYDAGITVTAGGVYTSSVYAKNASGTRYLQVNFGGGYGENNAVFDLVNGTVISQSSATGSIESVGNGWYRCIVTATNAPANTNVNVIYYLMNGVNTNYTGNGTSGVYLWGSQLEASSYATSYIPTTSTSATRIADACYKTGIFNLIGQTEGVVFADFVYLGGVQAVAIELSNSASADDIINLYITSVAQTQCYMFDGGSQVGFISSSHTFVKGNRYKIAIGYASNDLVLYINGTQIGTATPSSIPTTSEIYISRDKAASYLTDTSYNGVTVYKTRLTNAQLATLTTL